jgi:polysaccharide export outer membrane protein
MRALLLSIALAFGLAACASAPGPTVEIQAESVGTAETQSTSVSTAPEVYRIGALDLLEIKIFKLPDLDRTARVDQDGNVTLPLIGSVRATGKTVAELENEIAGLYRANYLQDPRVSVFIKEYASQRVAVTGAVMAPGIFFLSGPTSLLEGVTLAKGLNDVGSASDIALIRRVGGKRIGTFHDLSEIIAGTEPDPQLAGGDIIVVQASQFRQTMKDLMQTLPVLALMPGI